jgi:hypothetical protein
LNDILLLRNLSFAKLNYKIQKIWNLICKQVKTIYGMNCIVAKVLFLVTKEIVTVVCLLLQKVIGDTQPVVMVGTFSDNFCHRIISLPWQHGVVIVTICDIITFVAENLSFVTPYCCHCYFRWQLCHGKSVFCDTKFLSLLTTFCDNYTILSPLTFSVMDTMTPLLVSPKIIGDKIWTFGDIFACHRWCFLL